MKHSYASVRKAADRWEIAVFSDLRITAWTGHLLGKRRLKITKHNLAGSRKSSAKIKVDGWMKPENYIIFPDQIVLTTNASFSVEQIQYFLLWCFVTLPNWIFKRSEIDILKAAFRARTNLVFQSISFCTFLDRSERIKNIGYKLCELSVTGS